MFRLVAYRVFVKLYRSIHPLKHDENSARPKREPLNVLKLKKIYADKQAIRFQIQGRKTMFLTSNQFENSRLEAPLIGQIVPNFRPKRDRKAIKPLRKKEGKTRKKERREQPSNSQNLDTYV